MTATVPVAARPDSESPPPRRRVPWPLIGVSAIAVALCVPLGAVLDVVMTAHFDDRTRTSAIVVLTPAETWADGGTDVEAKLVHAKQLHDDGVSNVIMTAGPRRQAELSREALIAAGVPETDVLAVPTGGDTIGSVGVVAAVMSDLGWTSATFVTDPAHLARVRTVASGYGIDPHISGARNATGTAITGEYVARETAALLRYHLLSRWSQPRIVTS